MGNSLSTQCHCCRRGSTDSDSNGTGKEYSELDRQVIAAATDAAIARVRAMAPSAFATGHIPDDKNNEAKTDTTDTGEAATTTSSTRISRTDSGNAGKKNKAKTNMGNKALIVSSSWGGPIQGGVTDAVHLLIRLLRELGISVYCTALTAIEAEIKEAKEYGVGLIVPSPIPKFKVRGETPDADWLYRHDDYFPNLKELANVRFVFGFGMINADAAFKIEKDLFPRAAFSLINVFDSDVITPVVADCMDTELQLRRDNVSKDGQHSRYVFSVGGSIFNKYRKKYGRDKTIKHYRLAPLIDDSHFDIPSPEPVDDDEEFQILSLFKEHELADLKEKSVVMEAMNSVANFFMKQRDLV